MNFNYYYRNKDCVSIKDVHEWGLFVIVHTAGWMEFNVHVFSLIEKKIYMYIWKVLRHDHKTTKLLKKAHLKSIHWKILWIEK